VGRTGRMERWHREEKEGREREGEGEKGRESGRER
jgi:hypothetical protein